MKAIEWAGKGLRLSAPGLFLLLILLVFWRSWNWPRHARPGAAASQFRFEEFHSNDVAGVGIVEAKSGKPIWIEWYFHGGCRPDVESFFLHGTNVFNLHLRENGPPQYEAIFYGPGKSQVWWGDKGSGSFTQRISYDTNGDRCGFEVWYLGAWHPVDRRDKMNGIVVNGQWRHLAIDTNGAWTLEERTDPTANYP